MIFRDATEAHRQNPTPEAVKQIGVTLKEIDFKLNFLNATLKALSLSQSGQLRIIGINIPPTGDHSIITLGQSGIKTQKS